MTKRYTESILRDRIGFYRYQVSDAIDAVEVLDQLADKLPLMVIPQCA